VKDDKFQLDDIGRVFETFLQEKLPPREREVVTFVLKGYSSAAIANELNLAVATVKTYRRNIYAKLGISSQNELFSLFLNAICRHT
jgi:DNA-binding NarL/FixJ family response regulator